MSTLGVPAARIAVVALAVIAADIASKVHAESAFETPVDLPAGFSLHLGHNSGVAFGALGGIPPPLLIAVVALCAVVGVIWVARLNAAVAWLAAGLLAGGAVANLLDRIAGGSVTDFIDPPAWPAFNLADVAITAAIALVLLATVRPDRGAGGDSKHSTPREADAPARWDRPGAGHPGRRHRGQRGDHQPRR